MRSDLVSVIVPVYNARGFLTRCAASALTQDGAQVELILVDDGSTDGSDALCDELAAKDPRIRVIHQANGGVSCARNAGIAQASGTWLMLLDADDTLLPGALAAMTSLKGPCSVTGMSAKRCLWARRVRMKSGLSE